MTSAEYITSLIAGKVIDLALIGAGLKVFLTVASRLSLAAVKPPATPAAPKAEAKTETPPAPEAETAPIAKLETAA